MDLSTCRRWLPFAFSIAGTVLTLALTNTALADIASYLGYWLWCLVLPGTLVYRALRGKQHSLIDDLAMGTAVGLALEIVVFLLLSWLKVRELMAFWPILVIALVLAIRPVRRRVFAKGDGVRVSLAWSWSVAGIYLFLLAYLAVEFLRPVNLHPLGQQTYHIDMLYFLGIISDAKQHFPLEISSIAGEPLKYHWFGYAHLGIGSLVSGVDTPTVLFRTGLPPLYGLAVALMSVVGWRVSGRPWVGAGAAALTFVVGELSFGSLSWSGWGGQAAYTLWSSPSVIYSFVIGLAIIALIADQLGAKLSAPRLVLLLLFIFAAPGAKATVLPVTTGALALVCLVQLIRRKLTLAPWLLIVIVVLAQVAAVAWLYRSDNNGLIIEPLRTVRALSHKNTGLGLIGFFTFWGARLIGIPLAVWLRRSSFSEREWFLLGGILSGFAAPLILFHHTLSQLFFLRSGFLYGAILSAIGVAAFTDRLGLSPKTVWRLILGATAVSVGVWLAILAFVDGKPRRPWEFLPRVLGMALAIGFVALLIVCIGRLLGRRNLGWAAGLFVVLTGGIMTLPSDAIYFPNMRGYYHQSVGPAQLAAAAWIRANTRPDQLLATNGHCVQPRKGPGCVHLSYWLSGFSERRVLLESWGYSEQMYDKPSDPYCHPLTEKTNDQVFTDPTEKAVGWMWRQGVRTLVVDRRYGTEPVSLSGFADLLWQRDYIAIYKLRPVAVLP